MSMAPHWLQRTTQTMGLLYALYFALPWGCGFLTESAVDHAVTVLNATDGLFVDIVRYERGWQASQAEVRIEVGPKHSAWAHLSERMAGFSWPEEPLHFQVMMDLHHGPWYQDPLHQMHWGWLHANWKVVAPGESFEQALNHVLEMKLNGQLRARWDEPRLSYHDETSVGVIEGIAAVLEVDVWQRHYDLSYDIKRLDFDGVHAEGITGAVSAQWFEDYWAYSVHAHLKHLTTLLADKPWSLHDLRYEHLDNPLERAHAFEQTRLLHCAQWRWGELSLEDIQMGSYLDKISGQAIGLANSVWEDFERGLLSIHHPRSWEHFLDSLHWLIQHHPEWVFQFHARTEQGMNDISGQWGWADESAFTGHPLEKAEAQAVLDVTRRLGDTLLKGWIAYCVDTFLIEKQWADDHVLRLELEKGLLRRWTAMALASGAVQLEKERYRSVAKLHQGRLTLDDAVFPWQALVQEGHRPWVEKEIHTLLQERTPS